MKWIKHHSDALHIFRLWSFSPFVLTNSCLLFTPKVHQIGFHTKVSVDYVSPHASDKKESPINFNLEIFYSKKGEERCTEDSCHPWNPVACFVTRILMSTEHVLFPHSFVSELFRRQDFVAKRIWAWTLGGLWCAPQCPPWTMAFSHLRPSTNIPCLQNYWFSQHAKMFFHHYELQSKKSEVAVCLCIHWMMVMLIENQRPLISFDIGNVVWCEISYSNLFCFGSARGVFLGGEQPIWATLLLSLASSWWTAPCRTAPSYLEPKLWPCSLDAGAAPLFFVLVLCSYMHVSRHTIYELNSLIQVARYFGTWLLQPRS